VWTHIAYWSSWTNKQVRQSSLHRLQFVLKMVAVVTDTSTQSNTPLSHCSVDNVLTEVTFILRLVAASHGRRRVSCWGVSGALPRLHSRLDWDLENWAATSTVRWSLACFDIKTVPSHELGEQVLCPAGTWSNRRQWAFTQNGNWHSSFKLLYLDN